MNVYILFVDTINVQRLKYISACQKFEKKISGVLVKIVETVEFYIIRKPTVFKNKDIIKVLKHNAKNIIVFLYFHLLFLEDPQRQQPVMLDVCQQ